jgi:peroxiredoxin
MHRSLPARAARVAVTLTLAALPALVLAPAAARAAGLALGAAAPMSGVALKATTGRDVTLAAARGKQGLLVVFTCNHCPYAKAWQARIAEIGNDAQARGLGVIAVNANDPAAYPEDDFAPMVERAKSLGLRFPYAVDATSAMARAFGATRTPEAFLFDAKGRLVYHGTIDDNAQDPAAVKQRWLRDAVEAVLAGKPVATAETKALGCGIKFRAGA